MLNFIADRAPGGAGRRAPGRPGLAVADHASTSGTRPCPSSSAGTATSACIYAVLMAVALRVAAVPDDARVRDPDRRRQPGRRALCRACRPRRLIIWTMTVAGMLAGLAGATELLGVTQAHDRVVRDHGRLRRHRRRPARADEPGRHRPRGPALRRHAQPARRPCRSRPASRPSSSASSRPRSCSSSSPVRSSSGSSACAAPDRGSRTPPRSPRPTAVRSAVR